MFYARRLSFPRSSNADFWREIRACKYAYLNWTTSEASYPPQQPPGSPGERLHVTNCLSLKRQQTVAVRHVGLSVGLQAFHLPD
jgi:hypothetical protein